MKLLFFVCLFSSFSLFSQNEMFAEPAATVVPPSSNESDAITIYTFVEEEATFPGGMSALSKFLGENIKYPQRAVDERISGRLYIQFVVDSEGYIDAVKVKKGVSGCPECDQEAVRVVKMMPQWKPARNNNKAVASYFNLPVTFVLPQVENSDEK